MSALIAHRGLAPVKGETFMDRDGTKWLVKEVEQLGDDLFDIYLKSDNDYEDWFRVDSQMLVNYALTRRPASR